jgi:ammonia channel protein AmtB
MKNFKTVAKNVFYATSATLMCSVPAMAEPAVSLTVPDVDTSSLGAAGGAVLGLIALTAGVAIVIGVFKKSKSA